MALSQKAKQNFSNFWHKIHNISRDEERDERGKAVLRIRHVHLGSRIQQQKREGGKIVVLWYLFCSQPIHKLEIYFIFEQVQKKVFVN
jgi:hypothetical protein